MYMKQVMHRLSIEVYAEATVANKGVKYFRFSEKARDSDCLIRVL